MSVATKTNQPKYKLVYNLLISDIKKGKFQIGTKLPSEREIAKRFNVDMSTVRRAFKELTVSGIVDKRIGSGTYLKRLLGGKWEDKTVNIVLPVHGNPVVEEVAMLAPQIAAQHNRKFQIIYADNSDLPAMIQSFILHEQPTILLGVDCTEATKEMLKAPELFVVLAKPIDDLPSIICDDNHGIRRLMEYLRDHGHKRIAIFRSYLDSPVSELQQAVYKSCIAEYFTSDLDIYVDIGPEKNCMDTAYEVMLSAARKTEFSALLCLNDEIMQAALAALYKLNKKVPEDVSVVSVGNTCLSRYCYPPVTCYDPNLEQHLHQAFLLLEKNHYASDNCEKLRLINPLLIERYSVKKID